MSRVAVVNTIIATSFTPPAYLVLKIFLIARIANIMTQSQGAVALIAPELIGQIKKKLMNIVGAPDVK
jgi:hypothetical protein